jgi:hypothetical protein
MIVTGIAAIDAVLGRNWDIVVVGVLALALQAAVLIRFSAHRPAVPLRADLVRWLQDRAAVTGEPLEQMADRAVAFYRAELHGTGKSEEESR